jgi:glyoxylase-like metal-dependent hydrolase (beta-lactamase superfamily II)
MAGEFALDGGAMFGIVPQPMWAKEHRPDEKNRIDLAMRSLLVRGGGRTIVCETGIGRKWTPKQEGIFKIRHDRHDLTPNLRALGVEPEDVTDVILSHLHFDHAGGATVREGDRVVPAFPRATYHIQRRNLEAAKEAHALERRSYLRENYAPMEEAGTLNLCDGETEILPGIRVLLSDGHTKGMQLALIAGRILFCADLMPTASHVRIPFIMGYDLQPLVIVEEKKRVLDQAVKEGWILHFYHDPNIPAVRPERDGDGFRAGDRIDL